MANITNPGLSTLKVRLGYGVETTAGTKPAAFTWLQRVNSIGGVSLSTEQIDVSAIEDDVTKYTPGRQDSGGEWTVTFNVNDEVIAQLNTMIDAYEALTGGKRMWFEVYSPYMTNAFYVVAAPPLHLPIPETGQNEAWTMELTFTIVEYQDADTAIQPTA